jgi:hypothetical protein
MKSYSNTFCVTKVTHEGDSDTQKQVKYDDEIRVLVILDGIVVQSFQCGVLWCGKFSTACREGSIVAYVKFISKRYKQETGQSCMFVIPMEDGNLTPNMHLWNERVAVFYKQCINEGIQFYLCTLAQKKTEIVRGLNYLYLPLDDLFFSEGTTKHFLPHHVPWHERKSDLCWRGMCSGNLGLESARIRFVREINRLTDFFREKLCISNENVKLCRMHSEGKGLPEAFFAPPERDTIDFTEFMQHKIFFIVDGNVIASNHMWGFASGCVPVMISDAECWFTKFLVPNYHYIPVKYDLSDIYEKIEWIVRNDSAAMHIAKNAYHFAELVFSSSFQKEYLERCVFGSQ